MKANNETQHVMKPLLLKRRYYVRLGPLCATIELPGVWLKRVEAKKGKRLIAFECDVSSEQQLVLRPVFES